MTHATLTIVTDLARQRDAGLVATLSARLRDVGKRGETSAVPWREVEGLHFARFCLVEDPESSRAKEAPLPTKLVLSLVFDEETGGADGLLDRLLLAARRHVDDIFSSCDGFPGAGAPDDEVKAYLVRHDVRPALFYQGAEEVGLRSIQKSSHLRKRLENALDDLLHRGGTAETATSLARNLRAQAGVAPSNRASSNPAPSLPDKLSASSRRWRKLAFYLVAAGCPLLLLAGLPALTGYLFGARGWLVAALAAAPTALLVIALLIIEATDARGLSAGEGPDDHHLLKLRSEEDHAVQNALTHLAVVKRGALRWCLLRYVFWAIGKRVELVDRFDGALGGIASIHFARWIFIDRARGPYQRRRLLFLSDYDGSWESYLGEFVDRAASGLTAVWSNTDFFPETRLLIFRGARDEQRFKDWTRSRQIPTPVWFSAYPDQTIANVTRDARIAQLANADQASDGSAAWMALF